MFELKSALRRVGKKINTKVVLTSRPLFWGALERASARKALLKLKRRDYLLSGSGFINLGRWPKPFPVLLFFGVSGKCIFKNLNSSLLFDLLKLIFPTMKLFCFLFILFVILFIYFIWLYSPSLIIYKGLLLVTWNHITVSKQTIIIK